MIAKTKSEKQLIGATVSTVNPDAMSKLFKNAVILNIGDNIGVALIRIAGGRFLVRGEFKSSKSLLVKDAADLSTRGARGENAAEIRLMRDAVNDWAGVR